MLVTNRGIVIIMTNPQKRLSNKKFVLIRKKKHCTDFDSIFDSLYDISLYMKYFNTTISLLLGYLTNLELHTLPDMA